MDNNISISPVDSHDGMIKKPIKKSTTKKKKSFHFVKAAISLLRTKTDATDKKNISKPPPSPTSNKVINQILDSVRPLHVSDNLFPASPNKNHLHRHRSTESFDSMTSSSSPCYSFGESSTVFGSSNSLQDLENVHVQESDFDEGGNRNPRGLRKMRASSPFASAMDLLQLGSDGESDGEDDRNVEEDIGDENGGDEMIDTKADAFITQFYSKMRVKG